VIILLYGADELGMRRRLQELKDEADGGTGMLASNLTIVDGRDGKPNDVIGAALAVPFLSARRLVIVENLLQRFEPAPFQRDAGDDRGRTRGFGAWDALVTALEAGIPDSTYLVFAGIGVTKRNPMVQRLQKLDALDEEYPELKGEALSRYIRDEAAARGVRFRGGPSKQRHLGSDEWEHACLHDRGGAPTDPVELLKTLQQGNTLGIANELDKLALYTMGREVTVDDVYEVCAGAREFDTFAFTDAVMDGKLEVALHVMHRLRAGGLEDAGLLAILLGAYRRLAPVVDLAEQGASPEQIGAAMGSAGRFPNLATAPSARPRAPLGRPPAAYEIMVAPTAGISSARSTKTGARIVVMNLAAGSRLPPRR
jgi:DNA polymerase-3 subunit delta